MALSGLRAASTRANAAAGNIANAGTVGALDEANGPAPYTPVDVVQTSVTAQNGAPQGTSAQYVNRDPASVPAYEPDSPYADENGVVATPNVDYTREIVDLKSALSSGASAADIKAKTEKLAQASMKLGEMAYRKAQEEAAGAAPEGGSEAPQADGQAGKADDVVDADFTDLDADTKH